MRRSLHRNLVSYWKQAMNSPGHAAMFLLRRAVPFGIPFKDLEAYRISSWHHGRLPRLHLTKILPGIEGVDVTMVNVFQRKIGLSIDAGELLNLCAIERFICAKNVLEIGTYDGNTALNLAANLIGGGRVTTVDLPPDWDGHFVYDVPNSHWNVSDRNRVGIQYRQTCYESQIKQVLGDSARLDWQVLGPPFDLIFVDGCHYYDYVRREIRRTRSNASGPVV